MRESEFILSAAIQKNLLALHEAVELEAVASTVLRLIEQVVPPAGAALILRPLEFDSSNLFAHPAHAKQFDEWLRLHHAEDVWLKRCPPRRAHRVVRHTDHTPDALLIRTHFYRRVMRPKGIRYGSALLFWKKQHCLAFVLLVRSTRDGDFSDREMARLRSLYPYLNSAIRRVFLIQEERGARRALARAVAFLPSAIVLLSWDLRILQRNQAAAEACVHWKHGPRHSRLLSIPKRFRLPANLLREVQKLRDDIVEGLEPAEARRSVSHPEFPNLHCRLKALKLEPNARPMFLLEMTNLADPVESASKENWSRFSHLTPSERQLLPHLLKGASNREIAGLLGKSPATIRNQLHSIFRQLQVSSRHQLLARLLH